MIMTTTAKLDFLSPKRSCSKRGGDVILRSGADTLDPDSKTSLSPVQKSLNPKLTKPQPKMPKPQTQFLPRCSGHSRTCPAVWGSMIGGFRVDGAAEAKTFELM